MRGGWGLGERGRVSVVGKVGDPCDTLALGSGLGLGFRL